MLGVRLAKLTSNPDLVISDGESLFLAGVPPLFAKARRGRGLDPVPQGLRRGRLRQAARDDGRHPGRPARQPEHLRDRRLRAAEAAAARLPRRARATRSTTARRTGCPSTPPASSSSRSTSSPASARRARRRPGPAAARFNDIHRIVTNLGVLDVRGPGDTVRLLSRAPRRDRGRGARGHRLRRCTSTPTARSRETRQPDRLEELVLIREVLDPKGLRVQGGARTRDRAGAQDARSPSWSASGTRSCRPAWAGSPARAWSPAPPTPAGSASWPAPR